MCSTRNRNGLMFVSTCLCAGTGCGGFHEPGPCPPSRQPVRLEFGG